MKNGLDLFSKICKFQIINTDNTQSGAVTIGTFVVFEIKTIKISFQWNVVVFLRLVCEYFDKHLQYHLQNL